MVFDFSNSPECMEEWRIICFTKIFNPLSDEGYIHFHPYFFQFSIFILFEVVFVSEPTGMLLGHRMTKLKFQVCTDKLLLDSIIPLLVPQSDSMFNNFLDISNIQPVGQTYMIQEEPSRLASRSIFKGTCDVPFNICVAFNISVDCWIPETAIGIQAEIVIKYVIECRRDQKTIRRLIVFLIFCPNLLPALHCSMWPQSLILLFCCRKCSMISHREWQTSSKIKRENPIFSHTNKTDLFSHLCTHIGFWLIA